MKFKVFNEGIAGTNTAFILSRLEDNLEKYNPDMVITMMGINDYELNIMYKENWKTKIALFFENIRIYKLSKWLLSSWKNKLNEFNHKNMNSHKERQSIEKEDINSKLGYNEQDISKKSARMYIEYLKLGKEYLKQEKPTICINYLKRAIEINQNNYEAYYELGHCYRAINKLKEAEEMYKKAIKLNPYKSNAYSVLGDLYYEQGNYKKAEELYSKALEIDQKNEEAYVRLIRIYYEMNFSPNKIKEVYKKIGLPLKIKNINSSKITRYHYQLLYKKLHEKGIKYIAMQYPLRNINEIKNMLNNNKDIIFISNKENFRKALQKGKYEEYFTDKFAGDFGHCTPIGNRLIAENVANVILGELKIK